MKPQLRRESLWLFVFVLACASPLHAADVIKANNTNALNLTTSWSTASVPTSSDVAVWDATVTGVNTTTLGADLSWQGIRIANPGGAVTISNTANVLTLGSAGIDMSAGTVNLTIGTSLIASTAQTWNLNTGRTLNLWTVNTSRGLSGSGNINLVRTGTGTATIVMLPGNNGSLGFADTNSNSLFSGNWDVGAGVVVQMIRNGATAWGTGTINLNGGQIAQIQGNWTWTNAITLAVSTSSTIANSSTGSSRTLKLQGAISGSGNLTFDDTTGAMTGADNGFIITGTNTSLSGQVTIPSSRLVRIGGVPGNDTATGVGSSGTLGTASIVLNGTLTLSRNNTWTFDSNITSGSGILRIGLASVSVATHIVTVSGNNQHTGGTTLQSAVTLNIGSASALGSGTFTIAGNGIFDNTTGSAQVLSNALTLSGGSPTFTGTNDLTFGGAVTLSGNNRNITVTNANATLTLSNGVSGAFNLTKQGAGTLVLGGSSTNPLVTVGQGRLSLNGTHTAPITVNSAALISGSGSTTGLLTLASGGNVALLGGVTTTSFTANGVTFSGSNQLFFLNAPVATTTYDVLTYGTGIVTTPGNFSVNYRGSFTDDIGNQKYTFTAGEYGVTRTWNTTTGTWAVNTGTNFVEGDQKFFFGDQVIFGDIASDATVTLTAPIIPGSVTVNNAANTYTFAGGAIDGATSLTKSGAGALELSVANTYTGGTTLSQGTLIISNTGALGTVGTVTINDSNTGANNTTLRLGNIIFSRAITVANQGSGTVTFGVNGAQALPEFSGVITLNKDVTLDGTGNTDRLTFSGGITGTGNVTIAGGTNRVVFITSANTYNGTTTISANSILQLGTGTSTVNLIPDASVVTVNSGGFLKLAKASNSETIGGLAGSGTVRGHEGVASAASVLVINNTTDQSFGGVLEDGGAIGSTLSLTKSGSAAQTLSGANTYTGATIVNGGTLFVNGNQTSATGTVTVSNNGTTLAGNGTIGGQASLASGTNLSPGATANTAGTLTVNGATTIAGTYTWEIAVVGDSSASPGGSTPTATHDRLSVGSTLDMSGTVIVPTALSGSGFNNSLPYSWIVATSTGSLTGTPPTLGTPAGVDFTDLAGGSFNISTDSNNVYLNFTPVPEPALLGLALVAYAFRRGLKGGSR